MNYDLMDHGRYYDGSSPYDNCWAGGMGGKGSRDGLTPAQLAPSRPSTELVRERPTGFDSSGWPFPTGSHGHLF